MVHITQTNKRIFLVFGGYGLTEGRIDNCFWKDRDHILNTGNYQNFVGFILVYFDFGCLVNITLKVMGGSS